MRTSGAVVAVLTILALFSAPVLYVASEGLWYVVRDEQYFADDSAYRTVYAPLDYLGERWPAVYDARETLAETWLAATGAENPEVWVRPWFYRGYQLDVF